MKAEEKQLLKSFTIPAVLVLLMWLVKLVEILVDVRFAGLGIFPRSLNGLIGIVTSPFIHADWKHLSTNSIPMLLLGAALFHFYSKIAPKVLLLMFLLTGLWVWMGARESYHIGASGLVYALSSFLFVSGLLRREPKSMALSLIVVFLYGGMIWGVIPDFLPEKNISWESHLSGGLAGFLLAIYYRKDGPQRKQYSWEIEAEEEDYFEESEEDTSENERPYWDIPEPDQKDLTVVYKLRSSGQSAKNE